MFLFKTVGRVIDRDIMFRDQTYLVFFLLFSLAACEFRHAKITLGGEAPPRILAIKFVCFFSFFLSFLFLFLPT